MPMTTLLTIVACFAGVFALVFGVAGLTGLRSYEPPKDRPGIVLMFIDAIVTRGHVTAIRDIARNWARRPSERRLLILGFAFGALCIILVTLARLVS